MEYRRLRIRTPPPSIHHSKTSPPLTTVSRLFFFFFLNKLHHCVNRGNFNKIGLVWYLRAAQVSQSEKRRCEAASTMFSLSWVFQLSSKFQQGYFNNLLHWTFNNKAKPILSISKRSEWEFVYDHFTEIFSKHYTCSLSKVCLSLPFYKPVAQERKQNT